MSTSPDQVAEFVFAKAAARRTATLIQVSALAGVAACISLAALLQTPINQQRQELQLVMTKDLYKELPPKYAWVSAAGGTFRGIAADLLWMRADGLKEQGKYYELHQLAKWICTLQPRFATVWSFQSWNMAYNVSVATHTSRERWQWVYNGVRLLRDEGIPNNEKVVPLYHQLAWTYFHKMGDKMDDYHLAYKRIWAETMEVLLSSPPASASDEDQVNYFKPVAEAPLRLDEVIAKHPGVAKLVDQLKALDIDVEDADTSVSNLLHPWEVKFFKPYTAWQINRQYALYLKKALVLDEQTTRLAAFLDAAPAADLAPLVAYMRSQVLREQYKMDPRFMYEMTGKLGTEKPIPIDWRTPWAHAMYWGMYGTEKGRQVKSVKEFDLLTADRIVVYSLGQLARQGRYIFRPNLESPEDSFLDTSPDWRYVEAIHRKCLELGKLYAEKNEQVYNTAGETFKDFHVNTLHTAVLNLYLAGQEKQAQRYFEYLVKNYPDPDTGEIRAPYRKPFRDFVQQEIKDVMISQHEAIWLLNSLLMSAYISLGNGQVDDYALRLGQASQLYETYSKDTADDPRGRRTLSPWAQIQADALGNFVINPMLPLALRFAVWGRVEAAGGNPTEVKQRCYDEVRKNLEDAYGKSDLDINKAFPPPKGMEAWRQSHPIERPEQVAKQAQEKKKEEEKKAQK